MLKALINRQNDGAPAARQRAVIENARQIGSHADVFALIPTQDFLHSFGHRYFLSMRRFRYEVLART